MGKNKKKKSLQKSLKPLFDNNKVLLAALGGIATGISIAGILGTDKAKQLVGTIEESIKDFSHKVVSNLPNGEAPEKVVSNLPNGEAPEEIRPKRKAQGVDKDSVPV